MLSKLMKGRVWKFGDNIDTDVITPPDLLFGVPGAAEWQLIKENSFRAVRKEFYKQVKPGDILVAGRNFGFGSHREQANTVLPLLGFQAVIAESFARIYFRNSIAVGFPIFEVPDITKIVEEGEELQIDMISWTVTNLNSGKSCRIEPHSDTVARILEAGSIFEMMKKKIEAGEV